MRLLALSILLLPAALVACKSTQSTPHYSEVACTCGTADAAFDGCAHPLCLAGKRNPDNPDCVCGPLPIGGK